MIAIFLGAGFSAVGGVPLARKLFEEEPVVDRVTRQRLVARVLWGWNVWHKKTEGFPEEYLAYLQDRGGKEWLEAVWYVSLVIALRMARVEMVGRRLTITRHNLSRTTGIPTHEHFWSTIFQKQKEVAVLTTNYDVLAERGLRTLPRPQANRPGFHYGFGPERLSGGGYPSFSHIKKITVAGSVPLLKLHGSASWSFRNGTLVRYHDCRPAIRGDAAIVAPVTQKRLPHFLQPIWDLAADVLATSKRWIFVGYSLPSYDELVIELLRSNARHKPVIHVFDPQQGVANRYRQSLDSQVYWHPGLPEGIDDLKQIAALAT